LKALHYFGTIRPFVFATNMYDTVNIERIGISQLLRDKHWLRVSKYTKH